MDMDSPSSRVHPRCLTLSSQVLTVTSSKEPELIQKAMLVKQTKRCEDMATCTKAVTSQGTELQSGV